MWTDLGKFGFIAKVKETSNAILGISIVMVHDEPESMSKSLAFKKVVLRLMAFYLPFAVACVEVDDGLAAGNFSEARAISMQLLIGCIRVEPSNVDVGSPMLVVEDLIEGPTTRIFGQLGGHSDWDDGSLPRYRIIVNGFVSAI